MTRNLLILLLLAIFAFPFAHAQTAAKDKLLGKWQTEEKDVIEFFAKGNKIDGKLISSADETLKKKNPELIGTVIFSGLELIDGMYKNGEYLDLESKKSYPVKIEIVNSKSLKATFGSGIFSETHIFTRL
jgi:uncharacterized protein (DUF2147 family)